MHTLEFKWHGSDPSHPERKIPGQLVFSKLRHIPDQVYINVPEVKISNYHLYLFTKVRTSDDALLELRFMVFFELDSVEKMLDRTHDPIADFINSLTAGLLDAAVLLLIFLDVIAFTSALTYEMFLEKTEMLNNLDIYHQLTVMYFFCIYFYEEKHRAKSIGFKISKVAYRGYSSPSLQKMHDDAIQARTQLRLEADTEEQAQQLADLKLLKETERSKKSSTLLNSFY